jgi:hypothetical protein
MVEGGTRFLTAGARAYSDAYGRPPAVEALELF